MSFELHLSNFVLNHFKLSSCLSDSIFRVGPFVIWCILVTSGTNPGSLSITTFTSALSLFIAISTCTATCQLQFAFTLFFTSVSHDTDTYLSIYLFYILCIYIFYVLYVLILYKMIECTLSIDSNYSKYSPLLPGLFSTLLFQLYLSNGTHRYSDPPSSPLSSPVLSSTF